MFGVLVDGKEVFRSKRIEGGRIERFEIDLSLAKRLELRAEDGGDGKASDWGLWLGVELAR